MKSKLKEIHIYCDENLFNKIAAEARVLNISLSSASVNLLKKAFVKQSNDYAELIDFLDKRIVKKVDLSLVNFKYFLEKSKAETAPKTETKKPPETPKIDGDAYAKAFFDRMSKL